MTAMISVSVSQQGGKFFARFLDVAGKWCSIKLPRAADLEQAANHARVLASVCQGLRYGLPSPEVAPPRERSVYFAAARRGAVVVKIGFSGDVDGRLRRLESCQPTPIVLLAWRPGGAAEEREEHQRWAAYRERGEWFRLAGDLQSYVETLRRGLMPEGDVALRWGSPRLDG